MDTPVEVYLKADEVWRFFQRNRERLKAEQVLVAENTDTKYEIYLTDFAGLPQLRVFRGNIELHTESCIDKDDTDYVAKWLYVKYLFPLSANTSKQYGQNSTTTETQKKEEPKKDDSGKGGAAKAIEDIISEREDELARATEDFLEVVLEYYGAIEDFYGEGLIEEILDSVCQQLANEWGISVRRPFCFEDDDGQSVCVEYPYLDVDCEESDLADIN